KGSSVFHKPQTMKNYSTLLRLSIILFIAVAVAACGGKDGQSAQQSGDEASVNTLTEAEKQEGWQLLFDGQSMEHFRGFRKNEVPSGWKVENGTITLAEKGAGDIITKEQYRDFESS